QQLESGNGEKVYVTYLVDGERLTVEVRDHGKGFDWNGRNDDELPEGGLGISIIQSVCDEFEVLRPSDGPGASLRLTKLRRASWARPTPRGTASTTCSPTRCCGSCSTGSTASAGSRRSTVAPTPPGAPTRTSTGAWPTRSATSSTVPSRPAASCRP